MAPFSLSRSVPGWFITTLLIVMAGIPNFVPLLGVYALLGGTSRGAQVAMMMGLAATGFFTGLLHSAILRDVRALFCTATGLFLGYLPAPFLIFAKGQGGLSFSTIHLIVGVSAFCVVGVSQGVLMRWRSEAS